MTNANESDKNLPSQPAHIHHEPAREPNVRFLEVRVRCVPYLFVEATRDIEPGQELVAEHSFDKWGEAAASVARLEDMAQLSRELLMKMSMSSSQILRGGGDGGSENAGGSGGGKKVS